MSLRFLILEGNTHDVREGHKAGFGLTPAESYGHVLTRLAGGGHFDVLNAADAGASLPRGMTFADYDGVALTGSSLHVWQGEPEAMRQVEIARAVYKARVPFFGSCWGIQVAAVAAGGVVHRNPKGREVGFARKIMPNAAGLNHPLLAGRPLCYDAPCSHLDEVATLPPDATLLASNSVSDVQAAEFRFEGGTFWGVQYHPEYSLAHLAFLIEKRLGTMVESGYMKDDAQLAEFAEDLRALDANPRLTHPAWRYGLGADVVEPMERMRELSNFITHRVRPHAIARAA